MKKFTLAISLLSTFLLVSCDPTPYATAIMDIAEQRDIKVCTKGPSTACDIKTRIYIHGNDFGLVLAPTAKDVEGGHATQAEIDEYLANNSKTDIAFVPYLEKDGRFVLSVKVGNEIKYIGVESSDWKGLQAELESENLAQQVHTLTQFFQDNFDEFGWLDMETGTVDTTYKVTVGHTADGEPIMEDRTVSYPTFTYGDGIPFSTEYDNLKDLEAMGSQIESERFKNLAERLEANYGLSTDRANSVARNISAYNRLATKRSLTSREQNFFSKELLGVNYKNARNAILSGDKKDLDNLLETAADTNETSPEQVSAIINEIFL